MRSHFLASAMAAADHGLCSTAVSEAEPFLGVWLSEGWGIVLDIHGGDADIYEMSSVHCMLASAGSARNIDDVVTSKTGDSCSVTVDGSCGLILCRKYLQPASPLRMVHPPGYLRWWLHRSRSTTTPAWTPNGRSGWMLWLRLPKVTKRPSLGRSRTFSTARRSADRADRDRAPPSHSSTAVSPRTSPLLHRRDAAPEATVAGEGGLVIADLGDGVHYPGSSASVASPATARTRSGWSPLRSTTASGERVDLVIDLRATTTGAETEALLVATRFVSARTVVATTEARLPMDQPSPGASPWSTRCRAVLSSDEWWCWWGRARAVLPNSLALALAPLPG